MISIRLKSLVALFAAALLIASAITVLGGQGQRQKSKQKGTPPPVRAAPKLPLKSPEKERIAPETQGPGAPDITVSVNCAQESIGLAGKQIVVEASILASREEFEIAKATLAKSGGFWGELFTIEVRDSRGEKVAGLTPRLISKGDASVTLDGEKYGWLVWVLEPDQGSALSAGTYSFRVLIDTSKNIGDGWKGKAWSPPATLVIKAAGAALTEDERQQAALAEIRALGTLGRLADALQVCERFLQTKPNDNLMLTEKGDLLVGMGRHKDAVEIYDRALEIDSPQEEGAVPEPPFELLRKRERAAAEAAKSASTSPSP